MNFQCFSTLMVPLAHLFHPHAALAAEYRILPDETPPVSVSSLSFEDFQHLLFTEVSDELRYMNSAEYAHDDQMERKLSTEEKISPMEIFWDQILAHGWNVAELSSNNQVINHRKLMPKASKGDSKEALLPFVICSRTPLLVSGAQRRPPVIQFTGAKEENTIIISNDDHQTCFYVATTFKNARFLDSAISNNEYVIIPLTDLMKISASTFENVESKQFSIPTPDQYFRSMFNGEEHNNDWERSIRVTLVAGRDDVHSNPDSLTDKGQTILTEIMLFGKEGSNARRRLSTNLTDDAQNMLSLTDLFSSTSSITAPLYGSRRTKSASLGRRNDFSRSLELGLEATHSCKHMFENVLIRPIPEVNGFDIILNPEMSVAMRHSFYNVDISSTASNSHCVISLIIGLSVHPEILTVEVDQPISPDDFQAQWITQSNSPGKRPLFDSGLTGKGQIVSITDSGLDYKHRFFGPTSESIHQVNT